MSLDHLPSAPAPGQPGLPPALEALRHAIDTGMQAEIEHLERHGPEHAHPLIGRVYRWLRHYLDCGGKRMHGLAVVLAHRACGGPDGPGIIGVAAAFQLYHHHTLVHDDVYDEDRARRGWPTCHEAFARWFPDGNDVAEHRIFASDGMRRGAITALAYGKIVRALAGRMILEAPFPLASCRDVAHALDEHDLYDNAGQLKDVYHEGEAMPAPDACLANAWLKTGRLFEVCADAGARLADGSPEQRAQLRRWAGQSALAYQLQDDLEDLVPASEKGQGRGIATDLMHCKPTYLYAIARELAAGDDRAALQRWQAGHKNGLDAAAVIGILERSGAMDACAARVRDCVAQAEAAARAATAGAGPGAADPLVEFTRYFVSPAYWRRPIAPAARQAEALLA